MKLSLPVVSNNMYPYGGQCFSRNDSPCLESGLKGRGQALVATFVGRGDLENARRVLIRSTQLGALLGIGLSLTLWWPRNLLSYAFTSDAAVTQQVPSRLIIGPNLSSSAFSLHLSGAYARRNPCTLRPCIVTQGGREKGGRELEAKTTRGGRAFL